ncbi:MAG: sulfatase, partial [Proteobacteria bacterium]|nr:sulfatase [Pseudomonadota bacterium]
NPDDRKWFAEVVDLKSFEGKNVSFTFKTSSGPKSNNASDWSGWSEPRINSTEKKLRIKKSNSDNVILITVDTLRADHLHCYNYARIKTPFFDKLAKEGVVCKNAFSQTHITLPSHISIFTSLYLKDHKILSNTRQELAPDIVTIAEVLKKEGYRTAAAVSMKPLTPKWIKGIDRGFDRFFSPSKIERRAKKTNEDVFKWLEKNYHKKFFLWIHYFDPHMPYEPPPPYNGLYYQGDPRQKEPNTMKNVIFKKGFHSKPHDRLINWLKGVKDFDYPISQYDGEISYVDAQIGELLNILKKFKIDKKTLMAVTSDHGECLGEHNIFFAHQGLYDPVLHIPLIFWYPERLEPEKIDGLVASIDIMPTILNIVGLTHPANIQGKNILPIINGYQKELNTELYGEHVNHTQVMIRNKKWKLIKSLKDRQYHERFFIKSGNEELYDLENDPDELNNVAKQHPLLVSQFTNKLENWLNEKKPASVSDKKTMDEESREILRSLGYAN